MRTLAEQHNTVVKELSKRLKAIDKEGENRPQWKLEQRAEATDKARRESRRLAVELKTFTARQEVASRDLYNETRKGAGKAKAAPSAELLWRQQAALLLGLEPEKAIERYSYMLGKLTPDEKGEWRHVFDDTLELAVQGDPVYEFQAEQEIARHRTSDEKAVLRAKQKAERMSEFVPTLTAIFDDNFQDALDGREPASDPASVYDTMEQNIEAEFSRVEPVAVNGRK